MKNSGKTYAILQRKIATLLLLSASCAAFATLGDGGKKDTAHKHLLSTRVPATNYKNFTLRSGYNYRGSNILSNTQETKYFFLDRVMTYEKGNQTYILPMRKKVILDKVSFRLK